LAELSRTARDASLGIALSCIAVSGATVSAIVPDGAWLIDGTGAGVQIFDCSGLLCGRIIWLRTARDIAGQPASDKKTRIRHSDSACFAA
jgi:hypothetical protein